ncbi:PREDICTED: uncharacterized protein LOC104803175 [Tarenaya hassleriana]|uniref:uncharacterized protein LOC104803175 n=1 Tax=Tarenaya hassleriana TaxID=28532 RepID=UPI00053CA080|nr:PREDICTED: uncharacterized protein LOC104803175 [Tarenaya hassleriana]
MAKLNNSMVMFFVVVAFAYASMHVIAVEEGEPKQLWDQCLTKINPKCALDIVEGIFGNGTISDSCCPELIKEEKLCYDTLIKYMTSRPIYIAREAEYLKKSDDLWTRCAAIPTIA